jgi:RecA-family ATPase
MTIDRPLLGYLAKFKDFAKEPPVAQLYYPDTEAGRAQAEAWSKQKDERGFSIYSCIGKLRCQPRNKDNVAELPCLILDLDLRAMRESREEVLACLHGLSLPPDEIHDSGGGLHPVWHLKEPLVDDAGMAQAESIMRRLVRLLSADPKPTHRAALLRHVGTTNSRYDEPRLCQIIETTGARCDISEFEDMFDLYGDNVLLHYKNEEDSAALFDNDGNRLPIDLEAMRYGQTMHDTFLGYMGSVLGKGGTVAEAIETVVEVAERKCKDDTAYEAPVNGQWAEQVEWRSDLAGKATWWLSKHPEWLYTALNRKHEAQWREALDANRRPGLLWVKGLGLQVRTWRNGNSSGNGSEAEAGAKEETKQPNEASPSAPFILRPFVAFDPATIPPRQFLFGRHYQRRTVGGTVAPGGTGKSSLIMVEGVSMATALNLLGEEPKERCRVWYHNGEDSMDELNRRVAAICQYYNIPLKELEGWFFMTTGSEVPLRVAQGYGNLNIDHRLVKCITEQIGDNKIDVAGFDPFVTLHGVSEKDPGKVDTVARIFTRISDLQNCAVELCHHTRKLLPGSTDDDYTIDDARGAGSLKDVLRAVRLLNFMSKADAENAGIDELERTSYFRIDRGKANNSPPAKAAIWRKFVNVDLPNTDEVGVVIPWEFPGAGAAPTPERAEAHRKAEHVFLELLARFTLADRPVNDGAGHGNAPHVFAKEREAKMAKIGRSALADAMRRLFEAGKIKNETFGPPSRERRRIVIAED